MVKMHKHEVQESYLHECSACGRNLGVGKYEPVYCVDLAKVTLELCKTCKNTLARKLTNFK